jgi:hypothetical protein
MPGGMMGPGGGSMGIGPGRPVSLALVSDKQFLLTGNYAGEATLHLVFDDKDPKAITQLLVRVVDTHVRASEEVTYASGNNPLRDLIAEVVAPSRSIGLTLGHARVWPLNEQLGRYRVAGDAISVQLLGGRKTLILEGVQPGVATLMLWFMDTSDPSKEKVLSYRINVIASKQTGE